MNTVPDYNEIIVRGNRRLTLNDCRLLEETSLGINARTIVEIGSMDGCSSMVLGLVAKKTDGHLYCIEPNPKTRWKQNIQDLFLEDRVTLIMQASPWVNTTLIPKPIDYLFIDGDHRTRWCLVDYHFWERYVRPGGRIAFHDWTGGKGVGAWIQRAVRIILEDDKLIEVASYEASDRGMVVFEKLEDE